MFLILGSAAGADPRDLQALASAICEAAKLSSIEKLAIALEMDDKQLRRQLDGDGHFSLTRVVGKLAKHDPMFWPRFAWVLACRYGAPPEAKRSAWFAFGVIGHRRSLKMAARVPQKRSA